MSSNNFARPERSRDPARPTNSTTNQNRELLQVGEVATLTGLSVSYFDKGRIYGYGPDFIRLPSGGRHGKILYRRSAVEAWLCANECKPGGASNV